MAAPGKSFRVSTIPQPPVSVANLELSEWLQHAYISIKQLTSAYQRLQGNVSAGQPSQGTGSEGSGTGATTDININTLLPRDVVIIVDGTIYPLSVDGVNAALQKASSRGGGTVMVPANAGIQVHTTSVKIPNRCTLQGFGSFSNVATFIGNAQTNVTAIIENATQDGTQQYCAIRNIQVNGARGLGAIVGAGILYKDGCYVGSLIEDSLVIACSGNGIRFDGGDTHGVGSVHVMNVSVTTCSDDNIIVTGKCGDGIRFYSIDSEATAAGKACLRIERGISPTASLNHSINGYWSEGLTAADTIVLDEVGAVTIIDAFYDGGNHNSVIKITGTLTGSDGAFGSSSHLFLNIRGNIATIIDDQSSGVTVGTATGSRFVSMYKSPVATAQSSFNTEQMYGIQPQRQGPSTASASTVTLTDGSYFPITGVTQLDNITNAARFKGKLMVTKMSGALNVAHNSGGTGNIATADGVDFLTAADTRILWFSDGTKWWELVRAAAAGSGSQYLRRDGGNTVTGIIDFNNFAISGWRGAASSAAAQIDIISDKTAAAGAGINLRWNAAAAVAAGYYPLTVQYDNATGTRDVMKLGYRSTTDSVLWLPDKDGGNDAGITEVHIAAGSSNAVVTDTGTVGLRMLPNNFSGAIWFYVGAELALDIRKSGKLINFQPGYLFANTGVFGGSAGLNGTDYPPAGAYQWGFSSNVTSSTGLHSAWIKGLSSLSLTGTVYTNHLAAINYSGHFYSGQFGDSAVPTAPADGRFRASGWWEPSSSNNQAGVDVFLGAGPGTGSSTSKGDINFETPDATGSGTAVQALSTKVSINRIGTLFGVTDGSNIGLGKTNAVAAISTATTDLLTLGTDNQVQRYDVDAGGGAYTLNIDLDTAAAAEGASFWIYIDKAASANPTITVRDGSGGTTLISINNANAQLWGCIFVFDGANWTRHIAVVNDL